MTDGSALPRYYARRAAEYDSVYDKPGRQPDLQTLSLQVSEFLRDRRVLEVACGTGYWTVRYAAKAAAVLATDVGGEVLEIARAKGTVGPHVTYALADAYRLEDVQGEFDAGFAGFWWSHVPLTQLGAFLRGLHERLGIGARMLFVDNRYVEGSNTPLARRDGDGNTFQRRRLADGTEHEVLKNFPSLDEVRRTLHDAGAEDIHAEELSYFWFATYSVQRIA